MKIKCPKCKHEWEYKGNSRYYITCPRCYNKVNIQHGRNIVSDTIAGVLK